MDFDLSDDQQALRDAALDLLAKRCPVERVREVMDAGGAGGFDPELWAAMADQGWLGVVTPEHRGGLGLGMVEAAILLEQTGAHLAPVPLAPHLLAVLATQHLDDHPDGLGEALATGGRIGTAARTSLTRNADGTVSGRTEPVVFGATASVLVVPAGDELVAVDLAGVPRSPEPAMDRTRELAWIELAAAPATTLGDAAARDAHLNRGALAYAADMLGCAEAVMGLAVDYAKQRHQFGRPIGSFQAVKHRCADMLVDVEGMRSAVYYAAWALGAGDPEASVAASTAKIWCSDAGLRVAESALQVFGGLGFTWDCDVHLYLKRAQLDQLTFGDATWHRARLMQLLRARLASGGSII
jgi:alkylation response protein AidB-like acyl-CoA dehydrogenase